jgi:hypothetical protein
MKLIEDSYDRGCSPGEIQELTTYADIFRGLLSTFGFELKVNSPPADDFIITIVMSEMSRVICQSGSKQYQIWMRTLSDANTSFSCCKTALAEKYTP